MWTQIRRRKRADRSESTLLALSIGISIIIVKTARPPLLFEMDLSKKVEVGGSTGHNLAKTLRWFSVLSEYILAEIKKKKKKKKKKAQIRFWCRNFFIKVPIKIKMSMLTGKGIKFLLKYVKNCSKHIYVKTFDRNHLKYFCKGMIMTLATSR